MIENARHHNFERAYQVFAPDRIPVLENPGGDVWGNCWQDPRGNTQILLSSEEYGVLYVPHAQNATDATRETANAMRNIHARDSILDSAPTRARGLCLANHDVRLG